jgi:hypothetical protein
MKQLFNPLSALGGVGSLCLSSSVIRKRAVTSKIKVNKLPGYLIRGLVIEKLRN